MYEERRSRVPGAKVWRNTPRSSAQHAQSLVLPDGCTDLIFDGRRLLIAGPDTIAQTIDADPGRAFVGVRLPSGAGPALWGIPGSELVNQRVALTDVWPAADVRSVMERVATSEPAEAMEQILAQRWRCAQPDPVMLRIAGGLRSGMSVADVAEHSGFGLRQLHRRSLFAYGYGPKTLARILRFNAALGSARAGSGYALAATESGYADQSHFAREVRSLTGRTLTQLIETVGRPAVHSAGMAA